MAFSVQMPALGESVTEGTVTRWLKQEGDTVELDEVAVGIDLPSEGRCLSVHFHPAFGDEQFTGPTTAKPDPCQGPLQPFLRRLRNGRPRNHRARIHRPRLSRL